jgi:hypothetical protein
MSKHQTVEEMIKMGATVPEAVRAAYLFGILQPGLKVKRNGRVDTLVGDKTPLGLYRLIQSAGEVEVVTNEKN